MNHCTTWTLTVSADESTNMAFRQFLFDSMIEIGASLETLARHFIQVFTKIGRTYINICNGCQTDAISRYSDCQSISGPWCFQPAESNHRGCPVRWSWYRDDPSVFHWWKWRFTRLDCTSLVYDIDIQCRFRCKWTLEP